MLLMLRVFLLMLMALILIDELFNVIELLLVLILTIIVLIDEVFTES